MPCPQQETAQIVLSYASNPNALRVYFAVATSNPTEKLIIFDLHSARNPKDTIDGYRVVLNHQDGRWREGALRSIY